MAFLLLFLIPALVALGFLLCGKGKVTLPEFGVHIAAQLLVAGVSALIIYCGNTSDKEILNGQVTGKKSERVSCEHSYPCNCRTVCSGSGRNQTCSTVCDTCYAHSYDVDWNIYTSLGTHHSIHRLDSQGLREPPRFTATAPGEPVAETHRYTNYIKAAPGTLFRRDANYAKYPIPAYPDNVYDYYRLNRLVLVGVELPDAPKLRADLDSLNANLGPKKQANAIIVIVKNQPEEYFYALESAWIGGKKNDVITVISVDDALKPQWVKVMAWTTNPMVKVVVPDPILAGGLGYVVPALWLGIGQYYQRKPMADFAYLKSSIVPTPGEMTAAMIVGLLVSIGLGFFFLFNDVFDMESKNESRTYRNRNPRRPYGSGPR